jgi:ATP-binding cassette subfamily C (CFTR/MRP) protein 4
MTLAAYAKMKVSQSRIADFLAMEELPKELKNTATTGTSGEESATPSVVVMMKDITVSWGTHAGAPGGGTTAKKDKEEQTKETKETKESNESNESNEKESTAPKETAAVEKVVAAPVDKGPTVVLEHLNVSIVRGECIAVVGPVGSGKSAFCNTLLREMEMVHAKNTRYNNNHNDIKTMATATISVVLPLTPSFLFFPSPSSPSVRRRRRRRPRTR